jgi:hypothetical protein
MAWTSKNEVTIGQQQKIGFQIAGTQKPPETRAQLSFGLLRSEIYRTLVTFNLARQTALTVRTQASPA